jgi:hypothetical protein
MHLSSLKPQVKLSLCQEPSCLDIRNHFPTARNRYAFRFLLFYIDKSASVVCPSALPSSRHHGDFLFSPPTETLNYQKFNSEFTYLRKYCLCRLDRVKIYFKKGDCFQHITPESSVKSSISWFLTYRCTIWCLVLIICKPNSVSKFVCLQCVVYCEKLPVYRDCASFTRLSLSSVLN